MRTIQTFVLRLLVDPAAPQELRGALQAVSESETYPFADEQALLALLHRMLGHTVGVCVGEECHAIEQPQTAQTEGQSSPERRNEQPNDQQDGGR